MEPHISDFGLGKLLVDEEAHVTTVVAGTFGYLAPGMYLVLLDPCRWPGYPLFWDFGWKVAIFHFILQIFN